MHRVDSHKMFARTCPSGIGWKAQSQQSVKRGKNQEGLLVFQEVSAMEQLPPHGTGAPEGHLGGSGGWMAIFNPVLCLQLT